MKKFLAILGTLTLTSAIALAQTVVVPNPNQFTFTASPDHEKPNFEGYRMKLATRANQAVVVKIVDLGKPTQSSTNKVTVRNDNLSEGLQPNVEYVGDVYAYGVYGESTSKARVAKILVWGAPAAPSSADAFNVR